MLYKPKYCCQCGDEIERIDWKMWSSRRFCQLCETDVGHHDWTPRIVLGIGLIMSIFSLGVYLRTDEQPSNIIVPRQIVSQSGDVNPTDPIELPSQNKTQALSETVVTDSKNSQIHNHSDEVKEQVAAQNMQPKIFESPQNKKEEPVYFCGAATKKGTACSRRVKGGGRCWQHKGKEAILSEKELFIDK